MDPNLLAIILNIASTVLWEGLIAAWRYRHQKPIDEMCLDAFEQAISKNFDWYKENIGEIPKFEREDLSRVLTQKVRLDFQETSVSKLSNKKNLEIVTKSIVEGSVLVFTKSIEDIDYESIIYRWVEKATGIFKDKIIRDDSEFKWEILKQFKDNEKGLDEARNWLKSQFGVVVEISQEIRDTQREQVIADKTKKLICISCGDDQLAYIVSDLKTRLEKEKPGGKYIVEIVDPLNYDKIKSCYLFVGIYAYYYHDERSSVDDKNSVLEWELSLARKYYRQCMFFIANQELSKGFHPEIPKPKLPELPPFKERDELEKERPKYKELKPNIGLLLRTVWSFLRHNSTPREKNLQEYEETKSAYALKVKDLYEKHREVIKRLKEEHDRLNSQYRDQLKSYNARAEHQLSFIQILHEDFPWVNEFADSSEIISVLNKNIKEMEKHQWWVGLSTADIRDRWNQWSSLQSGNIKDRELHPCEELLPSPLFPLWEVFLAKKPWLAELKEVVIKLQSIAKQTSFLPGIRQNHRLRERLDRLMTIPDWLEETAWDSLDAKLRSEWCSDKLVRDVQNAISHADLQNQWHEAVQEYLDFLEYKSYNRCFLVMGRNGSGKTHFIADVLKRQSLAGNKFGFRCLVLNSPIAQENSTQLNWQEQFENLILKQAELHLQNQIDLKAWKSLRELDSYLHKQSDNGRLVILIDELGVWRRNNDPDTFLNNLLGYINEKTPLQNILWVITLDEVDYLDVSRYKHRWKKYACVNVAPKSTIEGWISLDAVNEGSELELSISRELSQIDHYPALKNILLQFLTITQVDNMMSLLGHNSPTLRLLAYPFVAWILADLIVKKDYAILNQLLNLRYIDFYEQLDTRRETLLLESDEIQKNGQSLERVLNEIVAYIVAQYLEGTITEGDVRSIENYAEEFVDDHKITALRDQKIMDAKEILKALIKYRFLHQPAARNDDNFELELLPFWEYRAASQLSKPLFEKLGNWDKLIEEYFESSKESPVNAGVCEFLLLQLESSSRLKGIPNIDHLLAFTKRMIMEVPGLRSAVWAATAKADGRYQNKLANFIDKQSFKIRTSEELSSYLYFLKYAETPQPKTPNLGIPWHLRVRLLSRCYSMLGEVNFGVYFSRSIIQKMFTERTSGEDLAKALAHTRGIEQYLESDDLFHLSDWAYEVLKGCLTQYLRHLCGRKWLKNGMNHAQTGNLLKNLSQ